MLLSGCEADQPRPMNELCSKRVLMFLAEGFEDAEAACMLDVLGWSRYRPSITAVFVELTGLHEEVRGAFGSKYAIDVSFDQVDPSRYDALIVPGGFHNAGFNEAYDRRVETLARAFRDRACPIATLCVGVLPVADAGLLVGGQATTYMLSSRHDNAGRLVTRGCEVVSQPVVDWGGVISCSGPEYSERVAYLLLEKLVGKQAVDEVRAYRKGLHE